MEELDFDKQEDNFHIEPAAQNIINQDIPPSEKVAKLVDMFHQEHLEEAPQPELNHPSFFAITRATKRWILVQFQYNMLAYWTLMVEAAREWFPGPAKTKQAEVFCTLLEWHATMYCWHERPEFKALEDEYFTWKSTIRD